MYILYIHIYIYKRCPLSYYQSTNDLMVTHALGQMKQRT